MVQLLCQQRGKEAVGVCAATGVAGIRIRGSTVHSFLGCAKAENDQDCGKGWSIMIDLQKRIKYEHYPKVGSQTAFFWASPDCCFGWVKYQLKT